MLRRGCGAEEQEATASICGRSCARLQLLGCKVRGGRGTFDEQQYLSVGR